MGRHVPRATGRAPSAALVAVALVVVVQLAASDVSGAPRKDGTTLSAVIVGADGKATKVNPNPIAPMLQAARKLGHRPGLEPAPVIPPTKQAQELLDSQ